MLQTTSYILFFPLKVQVPTHTMSSRKASVGLVAVVLVAAVALFGAHPTAAAPSPPAAAPANIPAAVIELPESAMQPGALSSTLRAAGNREVPALAKLSAECSKSSERCLKPARKSLLHAQRECLICFNWCWGAIDSVERHSPADEVRWFKLLDGCEANLKSLKQGRK